MIKDITGKKFNRLTAVSFSHRKNDDYYWNWVCECGKEVVARRSNVVTGSTKSCGCLRKEMDKVFIGNLKHGFNHSRFYNIWCTMLNRCNNPKQLSYKTYGGRGIQVMWKSFEEFRDDMYSPYQSHVSMFGEKQTTIDRIDNNSNYSKENCRWATYREQGMNTSKNRLVKHNGEVKPLKQWSYDLHIGYHYLYYRVVTLGWSIGKFISITR